MYSWRSFSEHYLYLPGEFSSLSPCSCAVFFIIFSVLLYLLVYSSHPAFYCFLSLAYWFVFLSLFAVSPSGVSHLFLFVSLYFTFLRFSIHLLPTQAALAVLSHHNTSRLFVFILLYCFSSIIHTLINLWECLLSHRHPLASQQYVCVHMYSCRFGV